MRIRIDIDLTLHGVDGEIIDLSHDVPVTNKKTVKTSRKRRIEKASNTAKATAASKKKKQKTNKNNQECVVCYTEITAKNFYELCHNSVESKQPHLVCTKCLMRICKERRSYKRCCPICRFQYPSLAIERFQEKQKQLKIAKKEAAVKKAKKAGKQLCGVCSRVINATNFWDVCEKNCVVCKFCVKKVDRSQYLEDDKCCPMCNSQYPRGAIFLHKNHERLTKQRRDCGLE